MALLTLLSLDEWDKGLDENTSSEDLTTAWHETWRDWRQVLLDQPWDKRNPQVQVLLKRLNLIQILQRRQAILRDLIKAEAGLGTDWFEPNSPIDPFAEE